MNGTFGALGTPGVGFFMMLLIGAVAGWLAEKITRSDHGLLTNILVGIAGSFVGTRLAEALDIVTGHTFLWRVLVATVGAALLIVAWRAVAGAGKR